MTDRATSLSRRGRFTSRGWPEAYREGLLALGAITVIGVVGYMVFEGWSFTDALYMTVITLTTVGYKEVRPSIRRGSCGPWSSS